MVEIMNENDIYKQSYDQYWDIVKDSVDKDGWTYSKEVPHLTDYYFEGNTGKKIEFEKSYDGEWRGYRWRPIELSKN